MRGAVCLQAYMLYIYHGRCRYGEGMLWQAGKEGKDRQEGRQQAYMCGSRCRQAEEAQHKMHVYIEGEEENGSSRPDPVYVC